MYAIIIIAIIIVLCDFSASYNTIKIIISNTLKIKILNSVIFITYKLRDALFIRNKAVSLLNI